MKNSPLPEDLEKVNILRNCFEVTSDFLKYVGSRECVDIADMGGGPGHHARYLQLCGKKVTHFDLLEPEYDTYNHIPGDFSNKKWFANAFDAIWSHHALEHVQSPIKALIAWNWFLRDNGLLYLTVPQIDTIVSPGHIVCFNIPNLFYLLSGCGFDVSGSIFLRRDSHIQVIARKARHHPEFQYDWQMDLLPKHIHEEIKKKNRFSCDKARFTWVDGSVSNIHKRLRG